jgi:hypothetical protein
MSANPKHIEDISVLVERRDFAALRKLVLDLPHADAGMGVEIEDADGLDLLERLKGGEGQAVELAETVAGITARMMEAAGEAARTPVLQGFLDGVASRPSLLASSRGMMGSKGMGRRHRQDGARAG